MELFISAKPPGGFPAPRLMGSARWLPKTAGGSCAVARVPWLGPSRAGLIDDVKDLTCVAKDQNLALDARERDSRATSANPASDSRLPSADLWLDLCCVALICPICLSSRTSSASCTSFCEVGWFM